MDKRISLCVVLLLLIVVTGCVSKTYEPEVESVEIEAKATLNTMPEGMKPYEGMTLPEGMMREEVMSGKMAFGDRNNSGNGYLALT